MARDSSRRRARSARKSRCGGSQSSVSLSKHATLDAEPDRGLSLQKFRGFGTALREKSLTIAIAPNLEARRGTATACRFHLAEVMSCRAAAGAYS